jgi:hypothetical protein
MYLCNSLFFTVHTYLSSFVNDEPITESELKLPFRALQLAINVDLAEGQAVQNFKI